MILLVVVEGCIRLVRRAAEILALEYEAVFERNRFMNDSSAHRRRTHDVSDGGCLFLIRGQIPLQFLRIPVDVIHQGGAALIASIDRGTHAVPAERALFCLPGIHWHRAVRMDSRGGDMAGRNWGCNRRDEPDEQVHLWVWGSTVGRSGSRCPIPRSGRGFHNGERPVVWPRRDPAMGWSQGASRDRSRSVRKGTPGCLKTCHPCWTHWDTGRPPGAGRVSPHRPRGTP